MVEVDWDEAAAEKAGYETFMLKEIHEQPTALADTLAERVTHDGQVVLEGLGLTDDDIAGLRQVIVVACGTSYHAGLVGKYALERWARLPVEIDVASEFRYRDPVIGPDTLCVAISQSGETADTLAAMRLARQAGAHVLAVTNIVGSQATREADGVLFTRAGLEIGVAATKTFEAQLLAMLLLGLYLGEVRGHLSREQARALTEELRRIPTLLNTYLEDGAAADIERVAQRYAKNPFFLYLGRNIGLPVCLEGALKLKEISYIPTEAYAAGEMKHGPIALLEEGSPVVVVATDGRTYDKLVSNIQEVKARGARVIAVASEGNEAIRAMADEVLYVPRSDEMLSPLLAVVPAAALRVRCGQGQRRDRGPTAQPGQDGHGGVSGVGQTDAAEGPPGDGAGGRLPGEGGPGPPTGFDLVDVARFREALAARPRLVERLFTAAERAYCEAKPDPAPHYAARFAAKEAVAKLLGFGELTWHDVEVLASAPGLAPRVWLRGRMAALAARRGVTGITVSLTHTATVAGAAASASLTVATGALEPSARRRRGSRGGGTDGGARGDRSLRPCRRSSCVRRSSRPPRYANSTVGPWSRWASPAPCSWSVRPWGSLDWSLRAIRAGIRCSPAGAATTGAMAWRPHASCTWRATRWPVSSPRRAPTTCRPTRA